jgi:hypothetical protein
MGDINLMLEIKCCTPERPDHFVREPKFLSCGDHVCSKCIGAEYKIIFTNCKQENTVDLKKAAVNKFMEKHIELAMKDISQALHSDLIKTEDEIKSSFF